MQLTEIGHAAASETFVTHSPHMAAIWTDLFESMIVRGRDLSWIHNGPGLARDARVAYSSLLGRYIVRAHLTAHWGVRVLVPLDGAKRRLHGTRYSIEKDPPLAGANDFYCTDLKLCSLPFLSNVTLGNPPRTGANCAKPSG